MSLFSPAYNLPQSRFSDAVRSKVAKEIYEYALAQGAPVFGLKELSEELAIKSVQNEVARIESVYQQKGNLPAVFISDADKVSRLMNNAITLIEEMDKSGDLEKRMAEIQNQIDRRENPEAYC
jgi:uncharacterized small protein (DUF1192 family)